MTNSTNLTISQILRKPLSERKLMAKYNASSSGNISTVIIDGIPFTDYTAFSFIWEKSYVKSPVRSGDGSIGNLNSYATFLTPHLRINFGLMSIDSYRALMNLIYSKNEFLVTCYDILTGKSTTNRMYFTTEEMPKLWTIARVLNGESWVEVLGVQDYVVEMVGTNMSVENVIVNYHTNPPEDAFESDSIILSEEYAIDSDLVIGANISLPNISKYNFSEKWVDNNGNIYLNNEAYRITRPLINTSTMTVDFYAQWSPTENRKLMLNYGIGEQVYNIKNNPITSFYFVKGQSIGTIVENAKVTQLNGMDLAGLPISQMPQVEDNNIVYTPYTREGWFTTSTIGLEPNGSKKKPLTNTSVINIDEDTTIYQIYTPKKYTIEFVSNGGTQFSKMEGETAVAYNSSVALPTPYRAGYTFGGWYLDEEFTKSFNGTMKPYNIKLYAKWSTND
jgi:uncharacterized repeat protein (TIGR02543 family)